MKAAALSEGLRGGAVMGIAVVVLGVLGLTPSLGWIPEAPLLVAFIVVPAAIAAVTGWRSASRTSSLRAGALAGAIAGAIGGCVGGLTYFAFGKPAANVAVGFFGGLLAGGALGAAGGLFGVRRSSD